MMATFHANAIKNTILNILPKYRKPTVGKAKNNEFLLLDVNKQHGTENIVLKGIPSIQKYPTKPSHCYANGTNFQTKRIPWKFKKYEEIIFTVTGKPYRVSINKQPYWKSVTLTEPTQFESEAGTSGNFVPMTAFPAFQGFLFQLDFSQIKENNQEACNGNNEDRRAEIFTENPQIPLEEETKYTQHGQVINIYYISKCDNVQTGNRNIIYSNKCDNTQTDPSEPDADNSLQYKRSKKICFNTLVPDNANIFVGMKHLTLLEKLHDGFFPSDDGHPLKLQVLSGAPGMGKSEIANQYARKFGKKYSAGVFWFSCETSLSVKAQISQLNIGSENVDTTGKFTGNWFRDNDSWLVVLDNVDDFSVIEEIIPKILNTGENGHILLTTRKSKASINHRQYFNKIDSKAFHEVTELDRQDAIKYVLSSTAGKKMVHEDIDTYLTNLKTKYPNEYKELDYLANEALCGIPLALKQAVACINAHRHEDEVPYSAYATLFRKKRKVFLDCGMNCDSSTRSFSNEDTEKRLCLWTTLSLSLHYLTKEANELLVMLSFWASDKIPIEMLSKGTEGFEKLKNVDPENSSLINFCQKATSREDAIRSLLSEMHEFSLIKQFTDTVNPSSPVLGIQCYSIFQDIIRLNTQLEQKSYAIAQSTVTLAHAACTCTEPYIQCYIPPHVTMFIERFMSEKADCFPVIDKAKSNTSLPRHFIELARMFRRLGQVDNALQALTVAEELIEVEHPTNVDWLHKADVKLEMAEVYGDMGNYLCHYKEQQSANRISERK